MLFLNIRPSGSWCGEHVVGVFVAHVPAAAPVALPLLVYSVHVHSLCRNKKRPQHAGNGSHQVEDLCGLQ